MPCRLKRKILGPTNYDAYLGEGLVNSANSITLTADKGPGEVLSIRIDQLDGTQSDFMALHVRFTVDGTIAFDDYLYWLLMSLTGYNTHGLFSTCDILAATVGVFTFKVPISFVTTFALVLYSANATGNTLAVNLDVVRGS